MKFINMPLSEKEKRMVAECNQPTRETIKLDTGGNKEIHHICMTHGLIMVKKPYSHDNFTAAGIVTSPGNSERVYLNGYNDKYYIFNGWEGDEYGHMKDKPGFIEMIDVTDLIPRN